MTTSPVSRWLFKRYAILWYNFKFQPFSFITAKILLRDSVGTLNVVFSQLRKYGWLNVNFDALDKRKKTYTLVGIDKIIEDITKSKK